MVQATRPSAETTSLEDTWPWRCLGCEGTIYHDAVYCRDCRPARLPSRGGPSRHPVPAFLDWIRREPYPTFLTKVTAVAGLELSLTALWLQLMLIGSVGVGHLPVVARGLRANRRGGTVSSATPAGGPLGLPGVAVGMDPAALTLRPADGDRLSYVEALLARSGLPSRDVRSAPGRFYVATVGADPVGVGGVEAHGSAGLLRSVVVERTARGRGLGTALCDALETHAADDGVETLYLLTTTATGFFAGRGYVEVERTAAPASVRRTAEFADLCPAGATCMRKPLRASTG